MGKADLRYTISIAGDAAQRYFDLWTSDVANQTKELSNLIQKELGGPPITKQLVIQTTTDEKGITKLKSEIKETGRITDQWNQSLANANKLQAGSVTKLRQQVNEAKQARDAIAKIGVSAEGLQKKINSINPAWAEANNRVRELGRQLEIASASGFWQRLKAEFNLGPIVNAGKALNELVNTFQSLSIVIGQITAPISALSNALNDIQQIDLLFKGIGGGPADVSKIFSESSRIALQYGVNLKTVREGFTQLTPVILASGGTLDNVSEITAALSSRFATFGLSADKSKRVMNGVIQAFGKGKLMAEELTQQISEADPAFKTDLANALQISVAELGEFVKAGGVTTEVLLKTLPLLAKNSNYFQNLGSSAGSAVAALGRGQATIEQVKNQLQSLTQLNLESLAQLFAPLLGAFYQVQAAVVDFITNLRQLEVVKTIISILNSLAGQLAGLFTAFTNVIVIIGKFIDPIFGAINAIEDLGKKFIGFGVVSNALAAIITGYLIKAIYGLAVTTIPKAITGIQALATSLGILNGQSLREFVTGIFNGIKGLVQWIAGARRTVTANIAQAASYKAVTAAALAAAAAKEVEANAGNLASKAAANNIRNNKGVEASLEAIEAASGGAAGGFTLTAGAAAAAAAVLGIVAYAYNAYKATTDAGNAAGKAFDEGLKSLRQSMAETGAQAQNAATDAEKFKQSLEDLAGQTRKRNEFEAIVDVVFMTDINTAIAILHAKAEMNKRFKDLEKNVGKTRDRIREYNKAQDESGKKGAALKASIEESVKAYDLLIQESIKAREELKKRAAESGAGPTQQEIIALKKFNEDIEKFRKARNDLIAETKAAGIELDVNIKTDQVSLAKTTVEGLKEQLKGLEESQTTAKVGEEGVTETTEKINGLRGLIKFIEDNPTTVRIKAQFEIDKAALEDSVNIASALLDNVKARESAEDSVFSVVKARNDYEAKAAGDRFKEIENKLAAEIKYLKERGAGAEQIKQKEKELEQVKEESRKASEAFEKKARQIEAANAKAKFDNLGQEQALEKQIHELKQQQQRTEADLAVQSAESTKNEALKAKILAEQNLILAQRGGDEDEIAAAKKIVGLAGDNVDLADKSYRAAQDRRSALLKIQDIEDNTLDLQQQAARNNAAAKLASYGLANSISAAGEAQSGYTAAVGESAGAVNQLTAQVGRFVSSATDAASTGGQVASGWAGVSENLQRGIATVIPVFDELGRVVGSIFADDPTNSMAVGLTKVGMSLYDIQAGFKGAGKEIASMQNGITDIERGLAVIPGGIIAVGEKGLAAWAEAVKRAGPDLAGLAPPSIPINVIPETQTAAASTFYNEIKDSIQRTSSTDPAIIQADLQVNDQGMASAWVSQATEGAERYRVALQMVNMATGQLTQAQQQYNTALSSGDPAQILSAAGNLKYMQETVQAAGRDLQAVSGYYTEMALQAQAIGLQVEALPNATTAATSATAGLAAGFSEVTPQAQAVSAAVANISVQTAAANNQVYGLGEAFYYADSAAGTIEESVLGIDSSLTEASEAAYDLDSAAESVISTMNSDETGVFAAAFEAAGEGASAIAGSNFDGAAAQASSATGSMAGSLETGAGQAQNIYDTLSSLDGLNPTVTVDVVGGPSGRFAGGPVEASKTYRVNELGKEAFLSASGRLSMINRPKNALWRAPSSGTVIPAHLTAALNIPSGGVGVAPGASRRVSMAASSMSSSASISRAITQALRASGLLETNNSAAANQAGQAAQLGKLTHAVNKLVDKDWNVQVNVKNPSPSSYVNMINRLS